MDSELLLVCACYGAPVAARERRFEPLAVEVFLTAVIQRSE